MVGLSFYPMQIMTVCFDDEADQLSGGVHKCKTRLRRMASAENTANGI